MTIFKFMSGQLIEEALATRISFGDINPLDYNQVRKFRQWVSDNYGGKQGNQAIDINQYADIFGGFNHFINSYVPNNTTYITVNSEHATKNQSFAPMIGSTIPMYTFRMLNSGASAKQKEEVALSQKEKAFSDPFKKWYNSLPKKEEVAEVVKEESVIIETKKSKK